MQTLPPLLNAGPYVAYTYAYPHKTAYRPFDPPLPLRQLWQTEPRHALFLYLHVPFCEYRCGFCNLFTQSNPGADLPDRYLRQLRLEAERVARAVAPATFARLAVGGGTPTWLDERQLAELFAVVTDVMGADPAALPTSLECSPATVTPGKLALLRELGVDRLSVGVQSFDDDVSNRLGRPQCAAQTSTALERIREARFPTLNVDLIYGADGQTPAGWRDTLRRTLAFRPQEIYLYPLYVRPLTGLGRRAERTGEAALDPHWDDERLALYRTGRDLLHEAGYEQVSLRMFRRRDAHSHAETAPVYRCQEDGMVGLGCGARSYTAEVHYSTEYAVGRSGVRAILADYLRRPPRAFDHARHGFRLAPEDQRRRYAILSLLQRDGLARAGYTARFGNDVCDDLLELDELRRQGLCTITPETVRLTERGLEWSDAVGPRLYSARVRRLMDEYEAR